MPIILPPITRRQFINRSIALGGMHPIQPEGRKRLEFFP
jgi:hypothetical protein